jgi:hypothetical protein
MQLLGAIMNKFFLCCFLCIGSLFADEISQMEYQYLDRLALETGTDKASNIHNYTETYATFFAPIRNKPIKFLEIGIAHGSSARLWDKYFPNAELHFIDICPEVFNRNKPARANYHILDQADTNALKEFINRVGGDFDVIIDDGGHEVHQQIISFQALFPFVRSGGLYIIEDLHTSYWRSYGGNGEKGRPLAGPGTAMEFFKNLVEDLNYSSAYDGYASLERTPKEMWMKMNEYQKHIRSIHFYKSMCFIEKL